MTSKLCSPVTRYQFAAEYDKIFLEDERNSIAIKWSSREALDTHSFEKSCHYNLFFGFFFDGTRNNYKNSEDARDETHSNVARLYDCFPGQSVPGVLPKDTDWQYRPDLYPHFFRVYIPGVGTKFQQVGDSGEGADATLGAAAANLSCERIVWALIQAINNVHRFFHKGQVLVGPAEARAIAARIQLTARALDECTGPRWAGEEQRVAVSVRDQLEALLRRLHSAVRVHWPIEGGRPARMDPGVVQSIYVSIFGFSRGATKARAFANWLLTLARLDAELCGKAATHQHTLGGFPLAIDFMGLFDTVASVGLANTMGNAWFLSAFDGHAGWADAERSLRVPDGVPCVHLVAAHEVRRSFPLDSVATPAGLGPSCREVIFPGVHSDIGGGYAPCEQGKGTDPSGNDMMSRIPLIYMYREARLSGVPLKLELAGPAARRRFEVSPATLRHFNDYIEACVQDGGTAGHFTDLYRRQREYYIRWRLARRANAATPLHSTDSFLRITSGLQKSDLRSANEEFEHELADFNAWMRRQGKGFKPSRQPVGFDDDWQAEWEEIAAWMRAGTAPLPPAMAFFFDEYVHDSRAWFKLLPGNPDNEDDMHVLLKSWVARKNRARLTRQRSGVPPSDGLTSAQRQAAIAYERTGQIPLMTTEGREPLTGARAGYLRYRKVYAGSDRHLLSHDSLSAPMRAAHGFDAPQQWVKAERPDQWGGAPPQAGVAA